MPAKTADELKAAEPTPKLMAINPSVRRAGTSRATFYLEFLPFVETVQIGRRRLVVVASLNAFIEDLRAGRRTIASRRRAPRSEPEHTVR
jgi:hypothetical protein